MAYMHRHAEARRHPASVLPDVRSVVMLGMNYHSRLGRPIARAQMRPQSRATPAAPITTTCCAQRLNRLLAWVQAEVPGCLGRGVVDTAPLLERDFARRAGLGWFGKNTMLLNKRHGSYFFLGALLARCGACGPTRRTQTSHCGTCTACLDACPTRGLRRSRASWTPAAASVT